MNENYPLLNELKDVLNDSEVKNNQDLTNVLIPFKIKLEHDEEYSLICTKLSNAITLYLATNRFKAPKSVLNLYNNISNVSCKYRGLPSFINWF
ncbi:bacteriocin immunity protein [Clostridium lacusfryxellense]|uniref:bacteriocin immunity protein n=1 Tax=Clostridium lacusfryxellense TaxID=205328 RepID=UPI001C0DE1F3|nr:bacteriocin immunity protein [Clostridium lacusfryxellense]MBU3112681.1 bacteriocin immunity protein [Clostridium lacusfryxellense]